MKMAQLPVIFRHNFSFIWLQTFSCFFFAEHLLFIYIPHANEAVPIHNAKLRSYLFFRNGIYEPFYGNSKI